LRYGLWLEFGSGVAMNFVEAAKSYRLSSHQGNSEGHLRYGLSLEFGPGVAVDFVEAAKYYRLFVDKGNASGQ
jgi:TPR repeat protein